MSEGVVTNATQSPIMSAASLNTQPTNIDETVAIKTEKPKKPPAKRIRKTAAQLKEEAAKKAEQMQQQQQISIQKEFQIPAQRPNGDLDTNMMPPPKVAEAPSVIAAASAKSIATNPQQSGNTTPQKLDQKSSPQQM
jgi:hypothetical protein